MKKTKRKKKKGLVLRYAEFAGAWLLLTTAKFTPLPLIQLASRLLGNLLWLLIPKRRQIALDNLRHAFGNEKTEAGIVRIAKDSFASFFLTFLEIPRYRYVFEKPGAFERAAAASDGLTELFKKAKGIHDKSGGAIFVTPHIGNWEVLPHVSSKVGIPLAVVVRPLDNPLLEKLVFADRVRTGQFVVPKKNALFQLQTTLQQGKSIGLLPDQSTMKGVSVEFFGRPATTTPVPAVLSITYQRPIVVAACCRKHGGGFEGFVSDPIMPGRYTSEKEEILRICREINREMEAIIRKYPEQYLWMHNRWKTYKGKKELMS